MRITQQIQGNRVVMTHLLTEDEIDMIRDCHLRRTISTQSNAYSSLQENGYVDFNRRDYVLTDLGKKFAHTLLNPEKAHICDVNTLTETKIYPERFQPSPDQDTSETI